MVAKGESDMNKLSPGDLRLASDFSWLLHLIIFWPGLALPAAGRESWWDLNQPAGYFGVNPYTDLHATNQVIRVEHKLAFGDMYEYLADSWRLLNENLSLDTRAQNIWHSGIP